MVDYTPHYRLPYPSAGDSVSPESRDFADLALTLDVKLADVANVGDPVFLTADSNIDTLAPGTYIVSNVVIARALDLPWEYPSVIRVSAASVGSAVSYAADTLEQPPRMFLRSRLNNGVVSAWAEVGMASGDTASGDSSGPVRRGLLVQGLTARKGGTIGTSGKGVIALRFDDAPAEFAANILPLLVERGLPFTRVTTSQSVGGVALPSGALAAIQDYSLANGGEVWNHGTDHANAAGDAAIYANLIGALGELRAAMPRIPVDCFAPPGGGAIRYDGHMPSTSISNFADTYAGRLLTAHHAIVSGYFPASYYKPLDGVPRDGQIHYSTDVYTLARTRELVDRARDWGVGVCMMWHSNNIGTAGNISLADFELALDYLVEQRDAGNVVVLTKSGMAVADITSDQRDNLLTASSGASSFSETIVYPQFRQNVPGSTRELVATVTGAAGASVTSTVGESTRSHTIPAGGALTLRHPVTIPLDVTALSVTINAPTTGARLEAV